MQSQRDAAGVLQVLDAESDLRASEKTIAVLERTQRQDREDIRSLQKRVEDLVVELATIKAKR